MCGHAWLYIGAEDLNSGPPAFIKNDITQGSAQRPLDLLFLSPTPKFWNYYRNGSHSPNSLSSRLSALLGSFHKSVLFYNWKDKNKNVTMWLSNDPETETSPEERVS